MAVCLNNESDLKLLFVEYCSVEITRRNLLFSFVENIYSPVSKTILRDLKQPQLFSFHDGFKSVLKQI